MRVTISDVAARAGVSTATVSYVLNGSNRVSEKTKQRVLEAVRELRYQPNALARGLVKDQTKNIGLVIPHTAEYVFSDPYFSELLKGVGSVVTRRGYFLLLSLIPEASNLSNVVSSLISQRRVDGIIMVCTPRESSEIAPLQNGQVPFTLIGANLMPNICSIDVDNEEGSYTAARHIIELGHTRIGYISGDMRYDNAVQRCRGFQRALEEANLEPVGVYMGDFTQHSVVLGARQLLQDRKNPVTAIVCASDLMAYGVLREAKEQGYSIPEDLSVIGFDDIPMSRESQPKLTTIRQPITTLGSLASHQLINQIENKQDSIGPVKQVIKTKLVVRNSTAAPRNLV